jgi:hypothetical protein
MILIALAAAGICVGLVAVILAITATIGGWQRANPRCPCGHCDRCRP